MTTLYDLAFLAQEDAGREQLQAYCATRGTPAAICDATGIDKGALSKMIAGDRPIGLEAAMLIELATKGAVTADALCPARAHLLESILRQRSLIAKSS